MSSRGVNKVILVGNLGQDPEIRYMPNGGAVANISLATSESWRDKQTGENREVTEWHRVVLFGKLAEVAGEYLRKGSQIYIEGQLRTRKWQDQSGQDKYSTEVVVNVGGTLQMLGGRTQNSAQHSIVATGASLSSRRHSQNPLRNRVTVEITGKVTVVRNVTLPHSPRLSSQYHSHSLQENGMMIYRSSDTVAASRSTLYPLSDPSLRFDRCTKFHHNPLKVTDDACHTTAERFSVLFLLQRRQSARTCSHSCDKSGYRSKILAGAGCKTGE